MKECKFCQQEMAEDAAVCPHCGKEAAEEVSVNQEAEKIREEMPEQEVPAEAETVSEKEEPAEETQEAEGQAEAAEAQEETAEENAEETAEEETSEQEPAAKKATPGKIAAAAAAVVVLLGILVALVMSGMSGKTEAPAETAAPEASAAETVAATVPADGNPEDVTCKGSYTVSDEEVVAAGDVVVATIGEHQLTNGQLQIYYWSMVQNFMQSEYGYYMMMYGLMDYTKPLDTQISSEDNALTWQQYFLKEALNYWQLSVSLAAEGGKAGMTISQEDQAALDAIPESLSATAASYGMTREDLLRNNMGPGATLEDYMAFQQLYCQGKDYYQAELEKLKPTQEQLEAFYAEHEEDYAMSGITKDSTYVDVRHILVKVEGGTTAEDGSVTYSQEEWDACQAEAQAILDAYLAGEKTEESFAALANEKSEDPGSNTNGGLYENVYKGQMVEPFENWCFDESRAYGDYGLVQTSYGYHVMFYVGSKPMWVTYAENDWITEQANLFIANVTSAYPMDVTYENISLGYINMGG